jgi:prepilin-type N-terminal cleavage/methylation domain-containing protein
MSMRRRGFTLIELMVTVAIIGVLAATAIPAFIKYTYKATTAEARQNVRKIYDGARQYYLDPHAASATDMNLLPAQFPGPGTGTLTHSATCCLFNLIFDTPRCEPDATLWETPIWRALQFSMPDPHYYGYYYGINDPFAFFWVGAQSDLDCDGDRSLYVMYGKVDALYGDGPIGTAKLQRIFELE